MRLSNHRMQVILLNVTAGFEAMPAVYCCIFADLEAISTRLPVPVDMTGPCFDKVRRALLTADVVATAAAANHAYAVSLRVRHERRRGMRRDVFRFGYRPAAGIIASCGRPAGAVWMGFCQGLVLPSSMATPRQG